MKALAVFITLAEHRGCSIVVHIQPAVYSLADRVRWGAVLPG